MPTRTRARQAARRAVPQNRAARGMQSPTSLHLVGFPANRVVPMRYASYQEATGTGGVLDQYVLSAGNINDPNVTGVGGQPLGHDQWAQFYNNWVVLSSRITVTFQVAGSTTSPPIVGVFLNQTTTTTGSSWMSMVEQGKSKYAMLSQSVAVPVTKFSLTYDAKKEFTLADVRDNEDRIGSSFGNSPADGMFFIVWNQSMDEATTGAVDFTYVIDYEVLVSQPKELTQS